jgi:hypothetical protein
VGPTYGNDYFSPSHVLGLLKPLDNSARNPSSVLQLLPDAPTRRPPLCGSGPARCPSASAGLAGDLAPALASLMRASSAPRTCAAVGGLRLRARTGGEDVGWPQGAPPSSGGREAAWPAGGGRCGGGAGGTGERSQREKGE